MATIVFGGLLSLVAYCGLLLVTRAVTPGELRDARDFVRRRLRRRAPVEAS